jgi:putative ABC transport system ATP-binding protein
MSASERTGTAASTLTAVTAVPADAVRLDAVTRRYGKGAGAVTALREVSIGFPRGSFTAVMGPSGSGKSTMLHCAAGLDRPTSGTVHLGGTDLAGVREPRLTELRRRKVGFVFQAFNLLPSLTVEHNVTLPLRLAGHRPDRAWLREVIAGVGLADRLCYRPAELSGGQQQRVAIARALVTRPEVVFADEPTGALVTRPEVVFADEPTGALDTRTGREVLGLLRQVVDELGQTVVMVTHDPVAASWADRVVLLADGRLAGTMTDPTPERVAERLTRLGE